MSSRQLNNIDSVTSKTLSDKDIIAATEDKVKDLEKKRDTRFLPKKNLIETPNLPKIASPRMSTKLRKIYNLIHQL